MINDGKFTNTTSNERLNNPRTYTADTDNTDMRCGKFIAARFAVYSANRGEFNFVVHQTSVVKRSNGAKEKFIILVTARRSSQAMFSPFQELQRCCGLKDGLPQGRRFKCMTLSLNC